MGAPWCACKEDAPATMLAGVMPELLAELPMGVSAWRAAVSGCRRSVPLPAQRALRPLAIGGRGGARRCLVHMHSIAEGHALHRHMERADSRLARL